MADPQHASQPFQLQSVMSELYHTRDLLDFTTPVLPSPSKLGSPSLLSSASNIAAAAGRRAAAVAASAGPSSQLRLVSPDRQASNREGTEVRCVEGYGVNMYIGGSDGVVEWWVNEKDGWKLRHKHTLFPKRPVSRIVLLPKVGKAFVLSESTLHPLTLPSLDPIPSSIISPLRGVVSVVLDDDELEFTGTEDKSMEMTIVIVRRTGLGIYRIGTRMVAIKDIPLPSAPTHHALFSQYLCAALPSTMTNAIIDLSDASLTDVIPISQMDPTVMEFDPNPNVVVIPGENEFLVTSYTGPKTLGVFLNAQGDPERGTIEWEDHPLSIAIESGYVLALLRNHSITIHNLSALELVQTITIEPSFGAFALSYSPYGISIRDVVRDERMTMTTIPLLGPRLVPPITIPIEDVEAGKSSAEVDEPMSGSGLTPPSSPRKPPITPRGSSLRPGVGVGLGISLGPISTSTAETLLIGPNGIMAVSPTSVILKLEKLCADRRLEEASTLVDEERRKGRRGEIDSDKATHASTLRFLHIYLGFHLFLETSFEKAGDYFAKGKIDPRLVVRLYTGLRGKTIGSAEEVEVYSGLKEVLEEMSSVEEIITTSISRNYSPHMTPDTRTAPEAVELRKALEDGAREMLTEFLRKTRASRRKGGARGADSRKIDIVIDTTLTKLMAEAGTTNELLAILAGSNDVVLSELEPFLEKRKYILSTVMRQQGKIDRVLSLLQEIAEDPTPDPLCEDPISELSSVLEDVKDTTLFRKYALWLTAKDEEKGLSILIAQNPKTGVKLDDASLVNDLRGISETAANRYLEHVVVGKKVPNRALHQALLDRLLDHTIEAMKDDGVKYHLEELESEYKLLSEPDPFPVFLAAVAPDTPIRNLRLKLMLFLQASPFIDLIKAEERLASAEGLKPEHAIVLGRLGKNRQALHLLAREIQDQVSAQTYCTLAGEILPPKIAHRISRLIPSLSTWASLGEVGRKKKNAVEASEQTGLVMELLGAYMRDGGGLVGSAADLLNAQSVRLDVLEVLEMVPDEWSLDVVSSFIQRSLRRQLHEKATWQILKAISAGQNLETSQTHLATTLKIPPQIITPSPASSTDNDNIQPPYEGSIPEKEYTSIDEKRGQPLVDEDGGVVGEKDLGAGDDADADADREGSKRGGGYFDIGDKIEGRGSGGSESLV